MSETKAKKGSSSGSKPNDPKSQTPATETSETPGSELNVADDTESSEAAKRTERELKDLARLNGMVNKMSKGEIKDRLMKAGLQASGTKEVLVRRLKNHYRKAKVCPKLAIALANSTAGTAVKHYDYLCVIDFEATCDEHVPVGYVHEIIEFPAVLLCTHNRKIVKEFHHYCRPLHSPQLTDFCIALTGITQDQVDDADDFPTVLAKFEEWMSRMQLGTKYRCAIVTDGPYDMGRFLYHQCKLSEIPFPQFGETWINIRKTFSNFYDFPRLSLASMLECLGLNFEGRQHCGLDDTRNIARITTQLLMDGATFRVNERVEKEGGEAGAVRSITKSDFVNDWRTPPKKNGPSNSSDVRAARPVGDVTNSPRKPKRLTVLSVEEQLRDLGVDPALEDTLELHYSQKLLKKTGRN